VADPTPEEHVPCNHCGRDDAAPAAIQNGHRVVRCRGCGLVYVNPRPPAESLPGLYADYHVRDGGDEASWNRLMAGCFREAASLLERDRAAGGAVAGGRLLDVGCGYGGFVRLMRDRGWDAAGIDPSPATVAAAAAAGTPVRLGTLDEAEGSWDAITLFYVLEHLPDPSAALRRLFGLLAPGGTLLLRVPHTAPIVRMLRPFGLDGTLFDPPYHLFDFPPAVLGDMLRKAGFTGVRTFPGAPTAPSRPLPGLVSRASGAAAAALHALSGGRILLPGVSKTTTARKPQAGR
jgi:SAM-dependent methyltransferase